MIKKKGRYSKALIVLIIILNVIYTSVSLYIFYKTGVEPTVLSGLWFAFTTGELWMLATIKKEKTKQKEGIENE